MSYIRYKKIVSLIILLFVLLSMPVYSDITNLFQAEIENFILSKPIYYEADIGISINELGQNQQIYSRNSTSLMTPASILKIFTTYACLKKLGDKFTFKTIIYLDSQPNNSTYKGNIYIIGDGDPSITTQDLDSFCKILKETGIKKINGSIIYDVSHFDEENICFFPIARNLYAPPCALSINLNCITLKLDEEPTVKVTPVPDTSYAEFNCNLQVEDSDKPSIPDMKVTMHDNYDFYDIQGKVTNWTKAIKCLCVSVTRPGLYFATLLNEKLKDNAIEFTGNIKNEKTNSSKLYSFYEIESRPLSEILKTMNKQSNNMIAQNLCKYIGMVDYGIPGTKEKGLKSIINTFIELGFDRDSFKIEDSCGLSPKTKITPDQITKILEIIYDKPEWRQVMINSLEAKEYNGLQCYIKSGTLSSSGVNSLAGYIKSINTGKYYAFCVIVNKTANIKAWSGTYTNSLINKITEVIERNEL